MSATADPLTGRRPAALCALLVATWLAASLAAGATPARADGTGTLTIDRVLLRPAGGPYLTFTASATHRCEAVAPDEGCFWFLTVYVTTPATPCPAGTDLHDPDNERGLQIVWVQPALTERLERSYTVDDQPYDWDEVPEPVRLCLYQYGEPEADRLLASADWTPATGVAPIPAPPTPPYQPSPFILPQAVCAHYDFRDNAQYEYDASAYLYAALDIDGDAIACERLPDRGRAPGQAPALTETSAERGTRAALRDRYGTRFSARHGYRVRCTRRSAIRWRCQVAWTHKTTAFRGTVTVWSDREPDGGARMRSRVDVR